MGNPAIRSNLSTPALFCREGLALNSEERKTALKLALPEDYAPYTDKYFLRALEILQTEKLNPIVRAQVFIRKGPGIIGGIDEALAILEKYSELKTHGGKVFALKDGQSYAPNETVMMIEGAVQDIVALETMYLGVLSAGTTHLSEGTAHIDTTAVKRRMKAVVEAAGYRPVTYFGARHWHWSEDAAIAAACFEAGARTCSTDIGARSFGKDGIGTIPHILENAYASRVGRLGAVVEASRAFDRVINPEVPRIALIDYNNREIDDSIGVARALGSRLHAVRVDTCGENVAQGALLSPDCREADEWRSKGRFLLPSQDSDARFWYGHGVTVTGVYALRLALNKNGFKDVKVVLSSGFGDPTKVKAFSRAEQLLGIRLFDALGVGGVYESRAAKTDIVGVQDENGEFFPLSKVGREYRPNARLNRMM